MRLPDKVIEWIEKNRELLNSPNKDYYELYHTMNKFQPIREFGTTDLLYIIIWLETGTSTFLLEVNPDVVDQTGLTIFDADIRSRKCPLELTMGSFRYDDLSEAKEHILGALLYGIIEEHNLPEEMVEDLKTLKPVNSKGEPL